jgi:cell division protein FtsX
MSKLVKVEGDVAIDNGVGVFIDTYEAEFILDDNINEIGIARSLIRKSMITPKLKKEITGFKHVRTMQVVSMEDTKEQAQENGEFQTLMLEAIELVCVPENLELRASEEAKIKTLKDAIRMKKARNARVKSKENGTKVD